MMLHQARIRPLLALLLVLVPGSVSAQGKAKDTPALPGEVFVILASAEPGPVDPSLGNVKALQEPPFNGFASMKIVSRTPLSLAGAASASVELPNGRHLQLTLLERMPDGRAKVQVSINRPSQKDYLPLLQVIASAGEPFFVAGQKHQGGTLIIGVRIGNKPTPKPAASTK